MRDVLLPLLLYFPFLHGTAGFRRLDRFLGFLVALIVWSLEKRIAAAEGAPPPGPLEETRERMRKELDAAVAAANARERLRRAALIVGWAVQGCILEEEAAAIAEYEARSFEPEMSHSLSTGTHPAAIE